MRATLSLLMILLTSIGFAQVTQRVRGVVTDKESHVPLAGVTVSFPKLENKPGATTDEKGQFVIEQIPVGKHAIHVSYVGYQDIDVNDVLVTAGKEVVLPFELQESAVKMNEVVISAKKEHINEMAIVSAKTFDVQETERYAGSRSDPARMASNFAGVQGGMIREMIL